MFRLISSRKWLTNAVELRLLLVGVYRGQQTRPGKVEQGDFPHFTTTQSLLTSPLQISTLRLMVITLCSSDLSNRIVRAKKEQPKGSD